MRKEEQLALIFKEKRNSVLPPHQCFSSNGVFCLICDWKELEDFALHPFVVTESLVEMEDWPIGVGVRGGRSQAAVRAHQTWAVLIKLPSIHPRDLLTPIIRLTPLPSSISSYFSQHPPLQNPIPVPSSDHASPFAGLKAPETCMILGCWWRSLHSLLPESH